ncbi:TPR and ankyrin repeat-containing protein 1-like [Punica granatum]|uniref:TPR and ankyrin repeat-containing protein 1-like n=3 Tax=Punica granatum TaxID=22663 RepID=A0A6P8D6V8_PUNGR|nr:TPR and ankyrin repeat-containing protein 1-like [Punica granatum]
MLEEASKYVLRQLFVTVSSKLCFAVKQQLSLLKSFTCGGDFLAESSSTDVDFSNKADQFEDIPDSFIDIPSKSYPLVITFSKFLMMLDGSIGVSYFERFPQSRDICREKVGAARSLALQAFLQEKEVNYEKFCAVYWPHFNERLTRNLDPSRVFTEIISHIKGSLHVGSFCSGRLSRTDYVSLSDGRGSHLTQKERHKVYDVFLEYEKKKLERGEFDLSDVVNDLHSRLGCKKIRGDDMDYVYIDEVQDLTMRQIGLFKYVSHNFEEGFVFSGDTAQTIGRGIDFKFEDVRRLFYNYFMQETVGGWKISKIFQLSQNFRMHSGILKLAQSVTDLLCHFFPLFVDVLGQETSHICGESPIFLELEMNQNSVVSIFGERGNVAGLGPEQVIIVHDDRAREEVLGHVGKQALVLTLTECKGLEFQDVVLYNFFGSSPMKNQWRVVYEYMMGRNLLDNSFSGRYPQFKPARHNILCSELKQLYVAITRARQRLWICENNRQFAGAMLDYWRKLSLIQCKTEKLDSSRHYAYPRA